MDELLVVPELTFVGGADLDELEPAGAQLEPGDGGVLALATAKVLPDDVDHHVEEEEGELFPMVKKMIDAGRLVAIAQEMMAMVVELEDKSPRKNVLQETDA